MSERSLSTQILLETYEKKESGLGSDTVLQILGFEKNLYGPENEIL
jgi:hypothetical protein